MNILYLCDEYPPGRHGGIGSAVRLQAREVVKKGHTVIVAGFYNWSYGGEDEFVDDGVQVYRFRRKLASPILGKMDSFSIRVIYRLFKTAGIWQWDIERSIKQYGAFLERIIKKHSIDIVEMPDFNDYLQYCNRYIPFPKLSVPVVVKIHGSITYMCEENGQTVPKHIKRMEAELLQQADAVCSVSKYSASKTAKYLDFHKNIELLYNGVEIPGVPGVTGKDRRKVIFTGTLSENKGIYELMDAWNIVHRNIQDARLYIYGKGPVSKVAAHLEPSARDSVFFKGHVSRDVLFRELGNASIGIFPSFAETFGLAAVECMACGTATVFSKRTTGPEIVQDGVTGLLVEPSKPEDIAEKICRLLNNPDVCEQLAANGKSYVLSNFNISNTTDKSLEFYKQVLTASKRAI